MKLIKPSYQIIEQQAGLEGVYRQIELIGRICYKSEDKITEDSAGAFVSKMIKAEHNAMLEHGTIYLDFIADTSIIERQKFYFSNPYSRVYKNTLENSWKEPHLYVTTNYRVLVENNRLEDLKYLCEPTEYHEKRCCVKFICDRGVSHEFVRHRKFSFAQESTRYCNYSKDKFNNELTFILPIWVDDNSVAGVKFNTCLKQAENGYFALLKRGWSPQQARAILPNAIKTELVMTGFTSDWEHFFDLRVIGTTGTPHPQAKELAEPLMTELDIRGYINK